MRGRLTARGEIAASHPDGRGAPLARRDDREYREYLREEQRRQRGCIARRMQPGFHHGLSARASIALLAAWIALAFATVCAAQARSTPAAAVPDDPLARRGWHLELT